jgi:hypothetical protein
MGRNYAFQDIPAFNKGGLVRKDKKVHDNSQLVCSDFGKNSKNTIEILSSIVS